jgi:thiamine-monophosphate kinase
VNLREVGEFGLIERIARLVPRHEGVILGIGDDAAAVAPLPGYRTLVTSDMLVEGVHFDLAFTDGAALGRKSLAVNLSDIAAMGGVPRYFLLSLAIPRDTTVEFLDAFIGGMLGLAAEHDVALIGGDTCASVSGLTVSVTLMGEQLPERVVRRAGARPGDLVFVTGTLGDAAMGLELLRRGERTGQAVARHLTPVPRVKEGAALAAAGFPTAMIDISDGLLADLGHILHHSHAGAVIRLDQLPLSDDFRSHSSREPDPFAFPLGGGEDYELLFTAPPSAEVPIRSLCAGFGTPVSVLGRITADEGLHIATHDGREYAPRQSGFNHFQ